MSCTCSDETFTFSLFKQNGVYKVEKCARLKKETSKKKSCEFYKETLINERKIISENCVEENCVEEKVYLSNNRNYRKELTYYIDMCEKFGINENYAGNIVHLLKVCGYRYIPQEKLSSLKKRLKGLPDKQEEMKSVFPIVLLNLPDNIKIKNIKKYKLKNNYGYIIISEDDTYSENSEKTGGENYTSNFEEAISEEDKFDVVYSSD